MDGNERGGEHAGLGGGLIKFEFSTNRESRESGSEY